MADFSCHGCVAYDIRCSGHTRRRPYFRSWIWKTSHYLQRSRSGGDDHQHWRGAVANPGGGGAMGAEAPPTKKLETLIFVKIMLYTWIKLINGSLAPFSKHFLLDIQAQDSYQDMRVLPLISCLCHGCFTVDKTCQIDQLQQSVSVHIHSGWSCIASPS